jgi:hypothetical protein
MLRSNHALFTEFDPVSGRDDRWFGFNYVVLRGWILGHGLQLLDHARKSILGGASEWWKGSRDLNASTYHFRPCRRRWACTLQLNVLWAGGKFGGWRSKSRCRESIG